LSVGTKPEPWILEAETAFKNCPRAWFDAEQTNFNRIFDQYLLEGFAPSQRRIHPLQIEAQAREVERAARSRDNVVQNHMVFAKAFILAPTKTHLKLAGTQGYTDLAVVACALERFRLANGQFPESLSALTPRFLATIPADLVTGQPLHYQRTPDQQFLLYSVGWNETDDNGELAFLASGRGPEKKEGDWVWQYPTRSAAQK
jgi:hypothetical protein